MRKRINKWFTERNQAEKIVSGFLRKNKQTGMYGDLLNHINDKMTMNVKSYTIGFYCMDCGAQPYARWYVPTYRQFGYDVIMWRFNSNYLEEFPKLKPLQEEIERYELLKQCPFCGGTRLKRPTSLDHYWGDFDVDLDSYFKPLIESVSESEKETADAEVEKIIQSCEIQPANNAINKSKVTSSPDELKKYLFQLIRLESSIYSLSARLKALFYENHQAQKALTRASCIEPELSPKLSSKIKQARETEQFLKKALATVQSTEVRALPKNVINALLEGDSAQYLKELPQIPVTPQEPTMIKAGLFNRAKVAAENERLQQQYQEAVAEYNKQKILCDEAEKLLKQQLLDSASVKIKAAQIAVKEIEAEIEKEKEIAKNSDSPEKALQASIENELILAEKTIKDTINARNELYAYDVVYGKYRDIVALTAFYEYLMSGRCTELEGPNGAYNIYEQEIRANTVISQFSAVIDNLDTIKSSQYLLYSEMQRASNDLSALNEKMTNAVKTLDKVGDQTEQIAYNAEVTAYYSKKNAELTDALGYMVALK